MAATKEELMTEILQMNANIASDSATLQFLTSLDPQLVRGFRVTESDVLNLTVYANDGTETTKSYTDLSVFALLLVNMIGEVSSNISQRESEKTAKEEELKPLLP